MKTKRLLLFLCLVFTATIPLPGQTCWPVVHGPSPLIGPQTVEMNSIQTYVLRRQEILMSPATNTEITLTITGGTLLSSTAIEKEIDENLLPITGEIVYFDEVIQVKWDSTGPGNIGVSLTDSSAYPNGCPHSQDYPVTITNSPSPTPVVSGCQTSNIGSYVRYTLPSTSGHTYQWDIQGGQLIQGQGTNEIIVLWGPNPSTNPFSMAFDPQFWSYFWKNGSVSVLESNGTSESLAYFPVPYSGTGMNNFTASLSATAHTVYPGYPPLECTNITQTSAGGTAPFSLAWNTGATTSSLTACPTQSTDYALTLTDVNGCIAFSSPITIDAIPVACRGNRVLVCHNGRTRCLSQSKAALHLNHGDAIGPCANKTGEIIPVVDLAPELKAHYNPTHQELVVYFTPLEAGKGQITLLDNLGKRIATLYEGEWPEDAEITPILSTTSLPTGIYVLRSVTLSGETLHTRILIHP